MHGVVDLIYVLEIAAKLSYQANGICENQQESRLAASSRPLGQDYYTPTRHLYRTFFMSNFHITVASQQWR